MDGCQPADAPDLFAKMSEAARAALTPHQMCLQLAALATLQLVVEVTAQAEQAALHMAISR
jgi:hypothetical protein